MILPVVRERFEALLRQPALEGVVSTLRGGAKWAGCAGLTELAKAIAAAHVTHELRRPAFLLVESNKKAEAIAETLRFSFSVFPGPFSGTGGGVAVFESALPQESAIRQAATSSTRSTTGLD